MCIKYYDIAANKRNEIFSIITRNFLSIKKSFEIRYTYLGRRRLMFDIVYYNVYVSKEKKIVAFEQAIQGDIYHRQTTQG